MFNYPHLDYFFKSIRKGFEFLILSNQENLDGEWIHLCYKKNCHFCSNDVTFIYSRNYASKDTTSRHLLTFVRLALQPKVPISAITSSMLQNSKCKCRISCF